MSFFTQIKTISITLVMLFGIANLPAQPYGCTGSGYPLIPNPGATSVALWPGGVFNATNFVAAIDGIYRTNWSANIDPGVTLNSFPFAAASAPTGEDALGQWIDEGIRYMFLGNGGGAVLSFPIAPKLSHAASCVSECVATNWPVIPPHGCVSGQPGNTIQDLIVLLGPSGPCWSLGAVQENIAVGGWATVEEALFAGYWGFIASDGGSNSSHFLSVTSCLKGSSHVMGVGVRFSSGGITALTVHHVTDVTGSSGTSACWQGNSSCPYGALPIELTYFGVMPSSDECVEVELGWGVASSLNADYVNIEISLNGRDFSSVGRVYSEGDHSNLKHYTFMDSNAPLSGVVYYRLKMVDRDGTVDYSSVISHNRKCGDVLRLSVYPNPFTAHVTVIGMEKGESFQVFDMVGRSVKSGNYNEEEVYLDLQPGIYFFRNERTRETVKIVKR